MVYGALKFNLASLYNFPLSLFITKPLQLYLRQEGNFVFRNTCPCPERRYS